MSWRDASQPSLSLPTHLHIVSLLFCAYLVCFTTMIFTRVLGCVSVLMLALAAVANDAAPTELQIDRTYVPEDCKVTAQNGDRLQVHYVSARLVLYRNRLLTSLP